MAYWLPGSRRYVDDAGRPVEPPDAGSGRRRSSANGEPVALVIHDRALPAARELEREIGAAARLAVDNERLRAEVLAQLEDLRASRARIVEAGDSARRAHRARPPRRRAAAAARALVRAPSGACADAGDDDTLAAACDEAQAALEELRDLAHGIYPAILTEAGLGPALWTLADEAPLPVELGELPGSAFRTPSRRAAYLVVAGAIEAAEHGGADHVGVTVRRQGGALEVTRRLGRAGASASHLADRVGALGGRLCVAGPRPARGDPVRVVVAEDTMLTREGIVRLLDDAGVEVVGQAERRRRRCCGRCATAKPDVAIVDIRMPPTHTDEGLVAAQRIRAEHPDVGVLVLSQYVEPSYALRLLEEHPEKIGYLLKERVFDVAVLVDALRRIDEGETVVDPTIVSRLLGRARRDDPLAELTPA